MDKNWEGTTESFVSYSTYWLKQKNLLQKGQEPTIRLVRDYVARGILTKPERRGKEVVFRYTQLVQFLACKALTKDGWPLKKIADDFSKSSFSEILALVPESLPEDKSIGLINSFKEKMISFSKKDTSKPNLLDAPPPLGGPPIESRSSARRSESNSAFSNLIQRMEGEKTGIKPQKFQHRSYDRIIPQASEGSPPPASSEPFHKDDFHSRMRNQHIERRELARTLRELNAPNSSVEPNKFTDFTIMPGTRIQLDNLTLRSLTRHKVKSIAKAIELTLLQNLKFNEGEKND